MKKNLNQEKQSEMVAPPPSNVREARQLSTHGQKFDRESLYEPI